MSTGMQLERSEVKMSGYYNNWSVSDMDKYVKVPLSDEDARSLKSGDYVYLTGTIYTARDAAHKRMQEALDRGEALPIGMKNNVIYYMGPSPAREGRPIGSAGPTKASRNGAVYFAAVGGAGALLSRAITSSEVIAYDDLGTEAIRKLTVKDFPAIVVIDAEGNNLYETAVKEYNEE